MKRIKLLAIVLSLSMLCLLCACSGGASEEPAATPVPEVIELPSGSVKTAEVTDLSMVITAEELSLLDGMPQLKRVDLSGSTCIEEIYLWAQAHPEVKVIYSVSLPDGSEASSESTHIDLSSITSSSLDAALDAIKYLPKLERIELGTERADFGFDCLDAIKAVAPQAVLDYSFNIYGVDCNTLDTTINLYHIPVEDRGEAVMRAMAYMPNLVSVDMDSCGAYYEDLARIRDAYPDVKVIWRVWFGDAYSVRTDVERILASQPSVGGMLTPENTEALKYCTAVRYLDVGHNDDLTDISFVAYMPNLEVAVLAMNNWTDATPLQYCTELEYLEMQTTLCTDLSPLSGLTKLRHLDIAYIPELTDISPLYSLTELERLWLGCNNRVPHEQVEEMRARAPGCELNDVVYDDPTGGRWRYVDYNELAYLFILHPRYEKLREQFGYTSADFSFYWNDPLYAE